MPLLRALRSALAVLWSACKSIDLEDCLKDVVYAAGHASVFYGCWLIAPAYGYIVLGLLLVLPKLVAGVATRRRSIEPEAKERMRWAS
jgi:uncharacterized membrane protein